MKIAIQNMVCRHCVQAVARILGQLAIEAREVGLGYAEIPDAALEDSDTRRRLGDMLHEQGFELIPDADSRTVQAVKTAVMEHVRSESDCRLKLSACIEKHVGAPYEAASRIFSAREGRTVEKYAIAMRVEWVKELLSYGTLTVSEIAFRTGYSSTAHLSRQFKAVTGLTPTQFVQSGAPRLPLPEV